MSLFRRKPKEPIDTSAVSDEVASIEALHDTEFLAKSLGAFFRSVRNSAPLQTYLQSVLAPKLTPYLLTQNLPKVVEVVAADPIVGPFMSPIVSAFFEAFNG